ncbi:MAG: right-handed parallel beta-helix repeat-containing protein, partial [Myxococcota bacterium]|nr:right-handed parallel beta-helix repeat-containing protein [Myxococcota bacterium]
MTVTGAPWVGIVQMAGSLTLDRVFAHENQKRGIHVQANGSLVATDCIVQGNLDVGVYISGSTATLDGIQVLDTQPDEDGEGGSGIRAQSGATLVATNCLVQGNHYLGLFVSASTATLEGSQILETQPHENGEYGYGIFAYENSSLTANDTIVRGNHGVGVFLNASTAALSAVQVVDTQPHENGEYGYGIFVISDSSLTANDGLVEGNQEFGVYLDESAATLDGMQVLDTQLNARGEYGFGILVFDDSTLAANDCLVQGNHDIGVSLESSVATLVDVQVLDTQLNDDGEYGRGINAQNDSTLYATGCLVQGNHEVGVYLGDSTATLQNCQVLRNQPKISGRGGTGISAEGASTLAVTDCLIQGNRNAGITVSEAEATVERTEVLDTHRDPLSTVAFGLVSQMSATVIATDLTIRNTDGPALY